MFVSFKQTKDTGVFLTKDSELCPENTWRIDNGNTNEPSVCAAIDENKCKQLNPNSKARWTNPTIQEDATFISLDGLVTCDDSNVDIDTGFSPSQLKGCIGSTTSGCPNDIYSVNLSARNKPMNRCDTSTIDKVAINPTAQQKECIKVVESNPKDFVTSYYEAYCKVPTGGTYKNPFPGNDCMCLNPKSTIIAEGRIIQDVNKSNIFWNNMDSGLYSQRGDWLKACNSKNYVFDPNIVSFGENQLSTCIRFDKYLTGDVVSKLATTEEINSFKNISSCYVGGKLITKGGNNGGNNNGTTTTSNRTTFIIIGIVVFIVFILIIILALSSSKKKETK